jgi:adenylylsulfate kinase-like enzyme
MTTKKSKPTKSASQRFMLAGANVIALQVEADGSYKRDRKTDLKVESLERRSMGLYKMILKPGVQVLTTQVTPFVRPHYRRMFAQVAHEICPCGKSCLVYIVTTDSNCNQRDCSFDLIIMTTDA